jgi:hypothetical protein
MHCGSQHLVKPTKPAPYQYISPASVSNILHWKVSQPAFCDAGDPGTWASRLLLVQLLGEAAVVRGSRVTHHWSAARLAEAEPKGGGSGGGTKRKGADAKAEGGSEGESGQPPTVPTIVRIDPVAIAGAANQVHTTALCSNSGCCRGRRHPIGKHRAWVVPFLLGRVEFGVCSTNVSARCRCWSCWATTSRGTMSRCWRVPRASTSTPRCGSIAVHLRPGILAAKQSC